MTLYSDTQTYQKDSTTSPTTPYGGSTGGPNSFSKRVDDSLNRRYLESVQEKVFTRKEFSSE